MLNIKYIRENPEVVRKNLEKRQDKEILSTFDTLLKKDKDYRSLLQQIEKLRHKRNVVTQEINELKKSGKDFSVKVKEAKSVLKKIRGLEEKLRILKEEVRNYLMSLPNLLHSSVPFGKDENDNQVIRIWGKKPKFNFKLKSHGELIQELGQGNFEKGAEVAGHGFYYLMDKLVLLDLALMKFAIDFLIKKGYTLVEPPFMLRRRPYEGVTSLEDFETMMYKIENKDLYLIATSEHPIAALYMNEILNEDELPKKFVGISPCFRQEIGSHGIDTKGLFRVHQFNKVEQFIFCKPEDSWDYHEELIDNAERLYKKLKLPYRIVNVCTGDIGSVAAKKYDLEVWMPAQGKYREMVSCSNCTDWQSYRLNIRYAEERGKPSKGYVHTLNSTAIATTRAITAIIENFQQEDGSVIIPKVLRKYLEPIESAPKEVIKPVNFKKFKK